jgi:glucoside 3-dehydrogenase (cytochrome c) hitch-hiker subunit
VIRASISRREALEQVATLLGGAISAPTMAGVLSAGTRRAWATSLHWAPRTLSPAQLELVATVAEHIIPQSDTPGARGAGVHRFVDTLLSDHYPTEQRERFLAGLANLQGKHFLEATPQQQIALLKAMDEAAYAPTGASSERPPETWFFRRMKEVTLVGYYTSEIGASRELRVNPMGTYRGDIPFPASGGREWS